MRALLLLLLLPLLATAAVETGELNGSFYRIDMPEKFNGTLIVYCHGYGGQVKAFNTDPASGFVAPLVADGFAVAQATYSAMGWAVKEALDDTEALRKLFIRTHGSPKRTFVMGHSMGGIISLAIIEKFPETYNGALPLCGPLGPAIDFMTRRVFGMLVVFDALYPGVLGPLDKPGPANSADIKAAYEKDPVKRDAYRKFAELATDAEVPRVLSFWVNIKNELIVRAGGNPFDNRDHIYQGFPDDAALNRDAKRFTADPRAAEYLRLYYTPHGRPTRPILAIHNLYDELVPAWTPNLYAALVRVNGAEANFVHRWVATPGHCRITPAEIRNGLTDLMTWADSGVRPASGEQK